MFINLVFPMTIIHKLFEDQEFIGNRILDLFWQNCQFLYHFEPIITEQNSEKCRKSSLRLYDSDSP